MKIIKTAKFNKLSSKIFIGDCIMARKRGYTDEELINAVISSCSMAQVLRAINLSPSGSNYKFVKSKIKSFKLDTSHFLGQAWSKGTTRNYIPKISFDKILVKNSSYLWTSSLKRRLLKEGLLEDKCYKCGITEWLGASLSLQLEHKNGDNTDNRIENLTLLCPNCHRTLHSKQRIKFKRRKENKIEERMQKKREEKAKNSIVGVNFGVDLEEYKDFQKRK